MEIKVSNLTLATASIVELTNFLTQVLDIGMITDEQAPYTIIGNTKIKFIETEITDLSHSTFLTLEIPEEEFQTIVEKFTFFMFRKGLDSKNYYEIHHDGVSLKDPDGRLWKLVTDSFTTQCLTV